MPDMWVLPLGKIEEMTDLIMPRRRFITGLVSLIAAPAVVRAESLMPVKALGAKPVQTFGAQLIAITQTSSPDGGFPVPPEFQKYLRALMREVIMQEEEAIARRIISSGGEGRR